MVCVCSPRAAVSATLSSFFGAMCFFFFFLTGVILPYSTFDGVASFQFKKDCSISSFLTNRATAVSAAEDRKEDLNRHRYAHVTSKKEEEKLSTQEYRRRLDEGCRVLLLLFFEQNSSRRRRNSDGLTLQRHRKHHLGQLAEDLRGGEFGHRDAANGRWWRHFERGNGCLWSGTSGGTVRNVVGGD